MNRRKANAAMVMTGVGVMTVAMMACKKDDPPAVAPQPTYSAYPNGTAYPPNATAMPGATAAPGASGQMATPNALAFACQNDSACGYAHCNTAAGKCAFPCANAAFDCIQGASCNTMTGFCVPAGMGGQ